MTILTEPAKAGNALVSLIGRCLRDAKKDVDKALLAVDNACGSVKQAPLQAAKWIHRHRLLNKYAALKNVQRRSSLYTHHGGGCAAGDH